MAMRKPVTYQDGQLVQKGDRVQLGPNVRHANFAGLLGKVRGPVKSRQVVTVEVDDGRYYDANPENVQKV